MEQAKPFLTLLNLISPSPKAGVYNLSPLCYWMCDFPPFHQCSWM